MVDEFVFRYLQLHWQAIGSSESEGNSGTSSHDFRCTVRARKCGDRFDQTVEGLFRLVSRRTGLDFHTAKVDSWGWW